MAISEELSRHAAGLGVLSVIAVGWSGVWSYVALLRGIAARAEMPTFGAAIGIGDGAGTLSTPCWEE